MFDIQKLSNLIVEFYEKLSTWENAIVDGSGFSPQQMHVVEILGINGSLKMKKLAEKIGITTGTLTVTIDNLEKKGVVVRKTNPEDRRSYVIELTPEGVKLHQEHNRFHFKLTEECLSEFTEQEKELFYSSIKKFIANF